MSAPSPTIEGFRAAFRRPSLTFAEIAWRWTLGATAAALFLFCFIEYLDTLPVTTADSALLSTRQPAFVVRALTHILRGSLNRAVLAALLVTLSLSVLWIIAASIGRLATVRALFHYFRGGVTSGFSSETYDPTKTRPIRALIDLNFLRVAVVLATILAFAGAGILSSFVSSNTHPRPGLAFTLFIPLAGVICIAGWGLNWWLSLAGIFAVHNEEDALAALSAAVSFFRERTGSVVAVSTWTGLAHLIAFSIATTVVLLPLAFIPIAPLRLVIAGVILVTLVYLAVVDWLYIARLAGYVCIAEMPDALFATSPLAPTSPSGIAVAVEDMIDRDEPILSDIPNLAVET
ncbi:MAG: hypothetical protein WBW60_12955 [Candidatus Sulfotelmatobacter sp.]